MAIDFSQVKSLTIPEGEVTKITDSSGNVLWQKITQGWHTIWSGTLSAKPSEYDTSGSKFTYSKEELELTKNIPTRVTWSWVPPSFKTVYYCKFPPDSWWGDYTTTKEEVFSGTPEPTNAAVGLLVISSSESGSQPFRIFYNSFKKKICMQSGAGKDYHTLGDNKVTLYKVEQYF